MKIKLIKNKSKQPKIKRNFTQYKYNKELRKKIKLL